MMKRSQRLLVVVSALGIVSIAFTTAVFLSSPTAAQLSNNSTYYDNHSSQVDNESWMQGRERPTLDNFTHYSTRVVGFYIGQEEAQDGVGPAGAMLLSLLIFGALLRGMDDRQVGPVAGVVLAIALAFAVVTASLAPNWIYAVGLFGIGLVLSAVVIRLLR